MKFNIAYPATGAQKVIEVDEERKLRHFLDKQLAAEVDGEALGEQFKGYIFKIKGGFDKQGFSMKQGVLVPGRVRLLMGKNTSCYKPRRNGERKRKSVRGCIVSSEIAVLNLVIVKKGDEELPGLTDKIVPRRLGPKRASKIRKLFALSKEDDVRKYVIRRELPPKGAKGEAAEGAKEGEGETAKKETATKGAKGGKKRTKAPKIQRLVTPLTLQRKRHRIALKRRRAEKNKADAAAYAKLLAQRAKEKRQSIASSRKSQLSQKRLSQKKDGSVKADAAPATGAAKPAAGAKAAAKPAAKGAAKPAKAAKPAAADAKAAAKPAAKGAAKPAKAAKPAAADAKAAAKPAAPKEPAAAKQKSAPKQQSPKNPKSKPASTPKK